MIENWITAARLELGNCADAKINEGSPVGKGVTLKPHVTRQNDRGLGITLVIVEYRIRIGNIKSLSEK